MALTRRATAWLNLAYSFGRHMLVRVPRRPFTGGADMRRFLDAVLPEGYAPLTPAEREAMPATMRCINCGLCALACPTLRDAPGSAWDEAWTFVAGPARSIDVAGVITMDVPPCADCDDCAAVCPTGVPIPHLAATVRRLAS